MSILVESLTKTYGTQKAVDGISFTANTGVLGFLGPNGAGKSTTMKILTGFIPQTSGKASVCGFDVEKEPLAVKRSIGYLPESNPLYVDMYVKESLAFIAGIHFFFNDTATIEIYTLSLHDALPISSSSSSRWGSSRASGSCSSRPSAVMRRRDRKSTRLNSSHTVISYTVFCLK